MTYSVKNVKTWNTYDGGGYQATIYKDGKPFFIVVEAGQGGELEHHPIKNDTYPQLREKVKEMELWSQSLERKNPSSADLYIEELVNDFQDAKTLKRHLNKNVVTLRDGNIYPWGCKYNEKSAEIIKVKSPTSIILNALPFDEALSLFKKHA